MRLPNGKKPSWVDVVPDDLVGDRALLVVEW